MADSRARGSQPRRGRVHLAQPYNIIPVEQKSSSPAAVLRLHSVKVTLNAIRQPWPANSGGGDIFDWLQLQFGFQLDNVRNQREHLVMLLVNKQMRTNLKARELEMHVAVSVRGKVLGNYLTWCSFHHKGNHLRKVTSSKRASDVEVGGEERTYVLLDAALFLLIWGEAANVRFMPECLCFIFHHMAEQMVGAIRSHSEGGGREQASLGDYHFLQYIILPLYDVLRAEADVGEHGAPHRSWRNYDDMNEYFWDKRCFSELKDTTGSPSWTMNTAAKFFNPSPLAFKHAGDDAMRQVAAKRVKEGGPWVGKTGFVEQRSFLHLFRSFDRHWIMLTLLFQALVLVATDAESSGTALPWNQLTHRDTVASLFSLFITWAGLRAAVGLMDIVLQWRIALRRPLLGLRMILKVGVAAVWVVVLTVMYTMMWRERRLGSSWTSSAMSRFWAMSVAAAVFLLPQALGLLCLLFPWLANVLENSDHLQPLAWWFQTRLYVGRGMHESTWDTFKYSLFWIVLLAGKTAFSYFLQVKPLILPTQELINTEIKYKWPQLDTKRNYLGVGMLWIPVVLVYAMDIQIWYAILSSVVGYVAGLFKHIGEIRAYKFLLRRFRAMPLAMRFNMKPLDDPPPTRVGQVWDKVKRFLGQQKLRFSRLARMNDKAEEDHELFGQVWNSILKSFREEDLLSDSELQLMSVPLPAVVPGPNPEEQLRLWPSVLLSHQLQEGVEIARNWSGSSASLWKQLSAKAFRKSAITETYQVFKATLQRIVTGRREADMLRGIFELMDAATIRNTNEDFKATVRVKHLPKIVSKAAAVLTALLLPNPSATAVVNALQTLYEEAVHDFFKPATRSTLEAGGVITTSNDTLLFQNAVTLPPPEDAEFYARVRRLVVTLTTSQPMTNVPSNAEAKRRITFFCTSMFQSLPSPPPTPTMRAFSVLTPYYSETVMYSKAELWKKTEEGISVLYYLQKVFPDEWRNMKERTGMKITDPKLWSEEEWKEVCLWASLKGQTLARTVRGMMYYRKALELLAKLEGASAYLSANKDAINGLQQPSQAANGMDTIEEESGIEMEEVALGGAAGEGEGEGKKEKSALVSGMLDLKFSYVLACQIYGKQKKEKNPNAAAIRSLLKQHPALRVAYVEEVEGQGGHKTFYSVLLKWNAEVGEEGGEETVFRVRLPGPVKLGEGKPENQNHAIIFTRGDALQTIDMNQENYLEEALKMRNLLQEFGSFQGAHRPRILGLREHVFTGSVSSLAQFMSAQETAFVTLGQRVLANPLKTRMHYGHPDVFDRLWFITRGGISKASKTINISEDIFAGFNCTLRGGSISHHEYIQVGKGRDVGLNQIALFEAKVASGNGEQVLSRDVYRLGHRLDFFRMLSFYYTSVGYFASTMATVLVVYAFLWSHFYFAMSGIETTFATAQLAYTVKALNAVLNQQFLVQIGVFTALPMIVEGTLEGGLGTAVWEFVIMQLQLAFVFFTFSLGTRSHYFARTIMHGGAKYMATGRGFTVGREKFVSIYRMYSRSHFVKATEFMALLILYQLYTAQPFGVSSFLIAFSTWLLVASWLIAPFVFNPSGFDWVSMVDDWTEFVRWLWVKEGLLAAEGASWEEWWMGEHRHLERTGPWGLAMEVLLALRFLFFQYAVIYQLKIAHGSTSPLVYLYSWVFFFFGSAVWAAVSFASERMTIEKHRSKRGIELVITALVVTAVVLALVLTKFQLLDVLASLFAFLPTGWCLLQLAQVGRVVFPRIERTRVWVSVTAVSRVYELMFAMIVALPVAVLSWIPGLQEMQSKILFNTAFSRGLEMNRLLYPNKRDEE